MLTPTWTHGDGNLGFWMPPTYTRSVRPSGPATACSHTGTLSSTWMRRLECHLHALSGWSSQPKKQHLQLRTSTSWVSGCFFFCLSLFCFEIILFQYLIILGYARFTEVQRLFYPDSCSLQYSKVLCWETLGTKRDEASINGQVPSKGESQVYRSKLCITEESGHKE